MTDNNNNDDNSVFQYKILDESHIEKCAHVMAQAFCDSPSYKYIFQNFAQEKDRIHALQWIFTRNMYLLFRKYPSALRGMVKATQNSNGEATTTEKEQVVACFSFAPNPHQKKSFVELLSIGLWQVPFRFGLGSYRRLLQVVEDMENKYAKSFDMAEENYIMLERMVVLPEYQGQGLGTKALKAALEESTNVEVRLSTQEERNVTFYKRLGFEVAGEQKFYDNDEEFKFHSWYMLRKEK